MAIAFFITALIVCFSAIMVVSHKNPVASALFLVLCMCGLAVLFLLLNAQFIAVMQIIVYAGAITVLILFIVMLLNMRDELVFRRKDIVQKVTAVPLALAFIVSAGAAIMNTSFVELPGDFSSVEGHVVPIAKKLFTDYLYPFEMVSVLLLVAMIGVVTLTKRSR